MHLFLPDFARPFFPAADTMPTAGLFITDRFAPCLFAPFFKFDPEDGAQFNVLVLAFILYLEILV